MRWLPTGWPTIWEKRRGGRCRPLQAAVAIGKQEYGVVMHGPEAAQDRVGGLRQRNETVPVAFGVANVYASAFRIDIANLQPQPFAQPQSQTVEREVEHTVTDYAGRGEQALRLVDRDDVE